MLTLCGGEDLSTAMANKCEMVSKSIRRKGRTVNDFHFLACRWVWLARSPANGPRTPSAIDSSSAAMSQLISTLPSPPCPAARTPRHPSLSDLKFDACRTVNSLRNVTFLISSNGQAGCLSSGNEHAARPFSGCPCAQTFSVSVSACIYSAEAFYKFDEQPRWSISMGRISQRA